MQKIKLISKHEVATDTTAFYFEKPAGFTYTAGQFVELTLIDPPETDAEGNTRAYSIASAPYEADLCFATRMRDTAFKRVLDSLPIGGEVWLDGPFGNFLMPSNPNTLAVFLIGGIGITPVRSMILQATHDQKPNQTFVFYSNRTPADAVFLPELQDASQKNPFLTFVPTMTNVGDVVPWDGKTGYISEQLLREYLPKPDLATYYLCGPEAMVSAMHKLLEGIGIYNESIHTEEFSGY